MTKRRGAKSKMLQTDRGQDWEGGSNVASVSTCAGAQAVTNGVTRVMGGKAHNEGMAKF